MLEMEKKYGHYTPASRLEIRKNKGLITPESTSFFRKNRTALDMINLSKNWKGSIFDDSDNYAEQLELFDSESCEVFSNCGE